MGVPYRAGGFACLPQRKMLVFITEGRVRTEVSAIDKSQTMTMILLWIGKINSIDDTMNTLVSIASNEISKAAKAKNKVAAIHSLALLHAEAIHEFGPAEFCKAVGIEPNFRVEVSKMIAAARYLRSMGHEIVPIA